MAQSRGCYQPYLSGPKPYVKVYLHTAFTEPQSYLTKIVISSTPALTFYYIVLTYETRSK